MFVNLETLVLGQVYCRSDQQQTCLSSAADIANVMPVMTAQAGKTIHAARANSAAGGKTKPKSSVATMGCSKKMP